MEKSYAQEHIENLENNKKSIYRPLSTEDINYFQTLFLFSKSLEQAYKTDLANRKEIVKELREVYDKMQRLTEYFKHSLNSSYFPYTRISSSFDEYIKCDYLILLNLIIGLIPDGKNHYCIKRIESYSKGMKGTIMLDATTILTVKEAEDFIDNQIVNTASPKRISNYLKENNFPYIKCGDTWSIIAYGLDGFRFSCIDINNPKPLVEVVCNLDIELEKALAKIVYFIEQNCNDLTGFTTDYLVKAINEANIGKDFTIQRVNGKICTKIKNIPY